MSFEGKYNTKSPAVKRLMREAQELADATKEYYACPLEDNLFEWHFTIRGPPGTEFENGVYHGRIILPPEYPMKPPNIVLLTPNGRFEIHKKICLSISGHHPETWQPSWSIRTALLALIAFMPTPSNDTIGSLNYSIEERYKMARKSHSWTCEICGKIIDLLLAEEPTVTGKKDKPTYSSVNVLNEQPSSESTNMPSKSSISQTLNDNLRKRLVDPQRLGNVAQENNANRPQVFPTLTDISWIIVKIFIVFVILLLLFRRLSFLL